MATRIERSHHVRVEAVVVGNLELDDGLRALVGACGEAILNGANHAGVDELSVYVEVEADQISAFVRDEGVGFETGSVPEDRRGIADSIVRRVERHGGSTAIRSEPGRGTEVVLRLPRMDR
jgi:signal transduction histidine kinase